MRFIESPQFYLSTDRDSNACEDFFPWRARINDNPTNLAIFQRIALKINEPEKNPTNPSLTGIGGKPHKSKKGRSRDNPRSALKREKPRNTGVFDKNNNTLFLSKSGYCYGAPAGTRTPDTLLKRQVLYLLSYWGKEEQIRKTIKMAGMAGLEPTISESKSGVLPLHYIPS